jgi:UDP-2,3-diacylglucosamine hydrolase
LKKSLFLVYISNMKINTKQLPDRVAFIADAHLGMPDDDLSRCEKVASFIRWLKGRISHLYIVGDLFDYWFEYTSVVPNIAPHVVFELYNLARAGTVVTIFGGNHDYWLGPYLRESVGLITILNDMSVEHQERTIYIHHGDGLYPNDHGYRILKKVLRNPVSIFLFRLLHPDFAKRIASLTSKTSRKYLAPPPERIDYNLEQFRNISDKQLKKEYDAVVYGHSHIPLVENRVNGTLVLLGDWITRATYVFLENGEFTLHTWKNDKEINNG